MRVLIVEDEAVIARRLKRLVGEVLGHALDRIQVVHQLRDARELINQTSFDVVLLDLNLNGENGFDLLTHVVAETFHTIIVSAHKDQALRAFEYGVLDFVGKPFDRNRLAKSFARIKVIDEREAGQTRFLAIRKVGQVELVPVEDVDYICVAGAYSELVLRNGSRELHNKSLEALMAILPAPFERIHKSYIVNMRVAVRLLVQAGSRYQLEIDGKDLLPVGRTRVKTLRERLG